MADIITYPENGITYDADDASGYLATRQSGVYSAEEDFAVTPDGGLTVSVSAGQAWVRPKRFRGRSIIMEQPSTLTLTDADSTRSRIDRVVLRYDAAARKTSLQVLEGTPDSSGPTPPEITRTELIYDLCLAEISRPAGSTAITSANITDTRADETVCGVMRDGVTGIPAAQLIQRLREDIENVESGSFYTRGEVDTLLAAMKKQVLQASGNVGQAVAVWSTAFKTAYFQNSWQMSGKIPDNVDYIVLVKSFREIDTPIIIMRGQTAGGAGYNYTFQQDGTLSSTKRAAERVDHLYGFHFVTASDGAMLPRVVAQTAFNLSSSFDRPSFTAADSVDYFVLQWVKAENSGDATVKYACSRTVVRGESYADDITFASDGAVTFKTSDYNGAVCTCYHYLTPDEMMS